MAAWLLFPDNTAFAKSILRSALPGVRSSHLAEAFAASLGFRTYAALLACQKDANPLRPPLYHTASDLFSQRLSELGYSRAAPDVMTDIAHHPEMPDPCWRAFPNGDLEANNFWYAQCKRLGIPNVGLHVKKKYVRLNWDSISISPGEDRHARDKRGELVRTMFKEFQRIVGPGATGKPMFHGSAFAGAVDNLMPTVAMKLADRLFEVLYMPLLDPEQSRVEEDWL
jgi:hypothetical protein